MCASHITGLHLVVKGAENLSVSSILLVSRNEFSQGLYTVFSDTRHINNSLTGYIHIFNFRRVSSIHRSNDSVIQYIIKRLAVKVFRI